MDDAEERAEQDQIEDMTVAQTSSDTGDALTADAPADTLDPIGGVVPGDADAEVVVAQADAESTAPLTLDELVAGLTEPAEAPAIAAEDAPQADDGTTEAEVEVEADADAAMEADTAEFASDEELEATAASGTAAEAETEVMTAGFDFGELPVVARMWTRVPFWILGAVWAGLAGAFAYTLWPASAGVFITSPMYPYFLYGAAALIAVGFVLGLIMWLVARSVAGKGNRAGVGRTVWMRAIGWTTIGVVLWWVALIALDLHRTGVIG